MIFFLYLMLDVYSRKIVAHEVHAPESSELAAQLIEQAVRQDNGSPMKGSTYLAKRTTRVCMPSLGHRAFSKGPVHPRNSLVAAGRKRAIS